MKIRYIILALMVSFSTQAAAQTPQDLGYQLNKGQIEICGITAENPTQLIEKIMNIKDVEFVQQTREYLTLSVKGQSRFWTIVVNDHPAAPAVICRDIKAQEEGGSMIEMRVSCFAEKPACDDLVKAFAEHNAKITGQAAQ